MCRSGSGLRRQRPRGPLSRRHGGAPQSGARVHAKAGDGRLLAIPQRPCSWGACSLGDAQCLVKCLLQGCPGIDDPAGPAHDPNSADTGPWTRDGALIAEGAVRPLIGGHIAPSILTRGTPRRTTHPFGCKTQPTGAARTSACRRRLELQPAPPHLIRCCTLQQPGEALGSPSPHPGARRPRCEIRRSPFQTCQV